MLKRTALYEEHVRLGARLIDFGGWELPVQYSGVIDEHLNCRAAAGLFDVSHMGEISVEGQAAEQYLNRLVTNNIAKLAVGQAQYNLMCNHTGGIVDDLVIYRRSNDRFLCVVNANNTAKDFDWMQKIKSESQIFDSVLQITNVSQNYSQIAIQGPNAEKILQMLTSVDLSTIKTYWFAEGTVAGAFEAIIARTGYTGEDGFEVYIPWQTAPIVWQKLLEHGKPMGLKPCGLGSRDTLRLEMKYPLYGNELSDTTNPLEAGLGWVVKFDKDAFIGMDQLLQIKSQGLSRSLVCMRLTASGIPRSHYSVFSSNGTQRIGEVTSGTQSPNLKQSICIAYVDAPYNKVGSSVAVEIRGQKVPAEVVASPFYKRNL